MASAPKPPIKEVAAMPFPASLSAMREHYDPQWGKLKPEGKLRSWVVEIGYEYSGRDTWSTIINAHNEDEARDIAGDEFDKADLDLPWDAEVDDSRIEAVKESGDPRPASADTRPKGGDATQIVAPFMSGVVPEGETPNE